MDAHPNPKPLPARIERTGGFVMPVFLTGNKKPADGRVQCDAVRRLR